MSAVADKLRDARALVAKGWTRESYARAADGKSVDYADPRACRWCAIGALYAVGAGLEVEGTLGGAIGTCAIISWNDRQPSKRSVLAAFDKAIELAEAQS